MSNAEKIQFLVDKLFGGLRPNKFVQAGYGTHSVQWNPITSIDDAFMAANELQKPDRFDCGCQIKSHGDGTWSCWIGGTKQSLASASVAEAITNAAILAMGGKL